MKAPSRLVFLGGGLCVFFQNGLGEGEKNAAGFFVELFFCSGCL